MYRKGRLREDRLSKLEALGFEWRILDGGKNERKRDCKAWFKQYRQLKEFKKLYHHTNVPHSFKQQDPKLYAWVSHQRKEYRAGGLREYRKRALDKIEFVWNFGQRDKDRRWAELYQELLDVQRNNRHIRVPRETKLYNWTKFQRQRFANGYLEPDWRSLLDKIGFDWAVGDQNGKQ